MDRKTELNSLKHESSSTSNSSQNTKNMYQISVCDLLPCKYNINGKEFKETINLGNSFPELKNEKRKLKIGPQNFVINQKNQSFDNNYELVNNENAQLGRGGYGIVQLMRSKSNSELRAIKKIKKQNYDQNIKNEIDNLRNMDHPNILKIYEYYEDSEYLYIITEYCNGGNLFDSIIMKGTKFTELQACKIMHQLISAVKFAHNQKIVHRDIKAENILLDWIEEDQFIIKLIDWGFSCRVDPNIGKLHKSCGTLIYIAPEVLNQNYDEKADIWSCGIVLYILLSGSPPFEGKYKDIVNGVKKGQFNFKYQVWQDISEDAKELVKRMLSINPEKRPSAEEILKFKWFEQLKSPDESKLSTQELQCSIRRLKSFRAEEKFQKAVISYIASHLISREEKQNLIKIFQQLDVDNDGLLSKNEIITGFRKVFKSDEECQNAVDNIIKKLDIDQNGYINYNEFIAGTMDRKKLFNKQNLEKAFKLFDQNNDGKITSEEIKNILGDEFGDEDDNIWKEILSEVDYNNDGCITFDEFCRMMNKFVENSKSFSQQSQECIK